ncbi:hypothetical protein K491DRAFT_301183 [Lophiostoma macrostomum CBS 122681]|uniref:Uncharacterized protein n=1 Tax=Lophiostoma macrostomum CBS 122681 TaxID=1314788 RepID=A0A6A6TDA4_9PLEO|nr:hypothetical protein K491DRAFT_301183 [Lophiostoma macrostomum CBS 122681]
MGRGNGPCRRCMGTARGTACVESLYFRQSVVEILDAKAVKAANETSDDAVKAVKAANETGDDALPTHKAANETIHPTIPTHEAAIETVYDATPTLHDAATASKTLTTSLGHNFTYDTEEAEHQLLHMNKDSNRHRRVFWNSLWSHRARTSVKVMRHIIRKVSSPVGLSIHELQRWMRGQPEYCGSQGRYPPCNNSTFRITCLPAVLHVWDNAVPSRRGRYEHRRTTTAKMS